MEEPFLHPWLWLRSCWKDEDRLCGSVGHHYSALPAPHSHPSAPFASQGVAHIQPGAEVFRILGEKTTENFQ